MTLETAAVIMLILEASYLVLAYIVIEMLHLKILLSVDDDTGLGWNNKRPVKIKASTIFPAIKRGLIASIVNSAHAPVYDIKTLIEGKYRCRVYTLFFFYFF